MVYIKLQNAKNIYQQKKTCVIGELKKTCVIGELLTITECILHVVTGHVVE